MAIFRDEYGDVVAWRVALAALAAVGAAVAVAVALFGPSAERGTPEEDGRIELPAPTSGKAQDEGLDGWLAGIEGSESLAPIGEDGLAGLRDAIESWSATSWEGPAALSVSKVSEPEGGTVAVCLHVAGEGGETWLEAVLARDDTWRVTEHPGGLPPDEGQRIVVSDEAALGEAVGPAVAAQVARQLLSSGIEGSAEAWTTPETIRAEAGVTRLTIWFPRGEDEPEEWNAAYDESFGMLEIRPAAEASGPESEGVA